MLDRHLWTREGWAFGQLEDGSPDVYVGTSRHSDADAPDQSWQVHTVGFPRYERPHVGVAVAIVATVHHRQVIALHGRQGQQTGADDRRQQQSDGRNPPCHFTVIVIVSITSDTADGDGGDFVVVIAIAWSTTTMTLTGQATQDGTKYREEHSECGTNEAAKVPAQTT